MYKKYNVVLDYIKIKLLSDTVDWENKIITVNDNIEHIIVNVQHFQHIDNYNYNDANKYLPDLIINNPAPTHQDINNYWQNLSNDIKNNIEFIKNLTLNINYFIAPAYINDTTIILCIILYSNTIYNTYDIIYNNYKIINSFMYLSTLNPYNILHTQHTQHKYNILNGILNYKIGKYSIIQFINQIHLLKQQIVYSNTLSINWLYIFTNILNYLPSFDIIYKHKNIQHNKIQQPFSLLKI